MTLAVKSSGQATAPVFTGASSGITAPSLTDTLPPFPVCRAFPGSEYYGGSAPPAPSADVAPILSPLPPDEGGMRSGHGRFPRSLLSGRRVRHPALPLRHRHRLRRRLSFPAGILNFESSCGVCDG